jgi:hypothetical protein
LDAVTRDKNGDFVRDNQGRLLREDGEIAKPTMAENIGFFMSYQVGWMYLRCLHLEFAGKQNDLQGVYMGDVRARAAVKSGYFVLRQRATAGSK